MEITLEGLAFGMVVALFVGLKIGIKWGEFISGPSPKQIRDMVAAQKAATAPDWSLAGKMQS